MADGMGLDGAPSLVATLEAAALELAGLTVAHGEAGRLLATRGAQTARRDSGYMAEHVDYLVDAGHVEIVDTADYAPIVHAYDPWLSRALDDLHDELIEIYANGIGDVVATIKGA